MIVAIQRLRRAFGIRMVRNFEIYDFGFEIDDFRSKNLKSQIIDRQSRNFLEVMRHKFTQKILRSDNHLLTEREVGARNDNARKITTYNQTE